MAEIRPLRFFALKWNRRDTTHGGNDMERPQSLHGADCGSSARRYASALLIMAAASSLIGCGNVSSDSPNSPTASISVACAPGSTTPATATLTWSPVIDPNLRGYRVYYGTASGQYLQTLGQGVDAGSITTCPLTGLSSNTTYYMVVTAFDGFGNESGYSNEVSKAIP